MIQPQAVDPRPPKSGYCPSLKMESGIVKIRAPKKEVASALQISEAVTLPPEVVDQVVGNLDSRSRAQVAQVARALRESVRELEISGLRAFLKKHNCQRVNNVRAYKQLDLSSEKLKNLPRCLLEMKGLEVLVLHSNSLSDLPPWFKNFKHLKRLDLSNNSFKAVPAVLRAMPKLAFVDLSRNQIRSQDSEMPPQVKVRYDAFVI